MSASLRDLRRKIKSIGSTKKITAAMQLVAASKMQRAVDRAVTSRAYSEAGQAMLQDLSRYSEELNSPFFELRSHGSELLVIIASNRGLAGPLNTQLFRTWLSWERNEKLQPQIAVVGNKARAYILRYAKDQLVADFRAPDHIPDFSDSRPLAKLVIDDYLLGTYRRVWLLSNRFVSTLEQRPELGQFLPIPRPNEELSHGGVPPVFEPDRTSIVTPLMERLLRAKLYQVMLEAYASEQSARMIAMKNATDNAADLIGDLELTYNSARQASITAELLDIAGGAAALESES